MADNRFQAAMMAGVFLMLRPFAIVCIFVTVICTTFVVPSCAAPVDSIRWEETMTQMVVTATRTPKQLKDVPVPTRVITSTDIKRADVTTVADLLQQELPGVEFSWAMSKEVNMNMSGFGGTDILFLVDGERLAGETMNNPDFQRLALDNVERIEIVRGAASSLYGSNAVGGVINIITRKATRPFDVNLNARTGTHADNRFGGSLSFRTGRVSNVLATQYTHMGKYSMSPCVGAIDNALVSNENHTWNVNERFSWMPCDRMTLTARAGYFYRERCYDASENNRYRDFSCGLRGEYCFAKDHTIGISYTFDQYDKSDYSLITCYDVRDYSNVQNTLRAIYNNRICKSGTITVGADIMRDYLMSYMFSDGGKHQYTADGFVQFDWEATSCWEFVGGLRYDYYSASSANSLTGKFAMRFKAGDCITLRASYSGGFRAPTLKEMHMNFDMAGIFMIYGNKDLRAERSHNLQLSAECDWHGWNMTASVSHNFVTNRIATVWDNNATGLYGNMGAMRYRNISDMDICGAEASIRKCFGVHWDARVSYCYNYVHQRSGDLYTDDTRPHSITGKIGYVLPFGSLRRPFTFSLNTSARYLSSLDVYELDDSYSRLNTYKTHYNSYAIMKIAASLSLPFGFTVTCAADNLLNYRPRQYTYYSPKTTGTTFTVGLSYDFAR